MTAYILARDLNDARSWCRHNGVKPADGVYCGQSWNFPSRLLAETDIIVRTALHKQHPAAPEIERALQRVLDGNGLIETVHGRLVRQVA